MSHRPHTSASHDEGPPSAQPSQASPPAAVGASYHSFKIQPQKPLLKGPRVAHHQDRKTESPSTSAPWKDPPQAAAASAAHKRSLKDGALPRQSGSMGPPPLPSDRPIRGNGSAAVRRQGEGLLTARERGMQKIWADLDDLERRVDWLESRVRR